MSPAKSIIRIIITQVYERSMVVHSQPNLREQALETSKTRHDELLHTLLSCRMILEFHRKTIVRFSSIYAS